MIDCNKCNKDIDFPQLCVHLEIGKMGRMTPDDNISRWYHFECYEEMKVIEK